MSASAFRISRETDAQTLIEKIVRLHIRESRYWKASLHFKICVKQKQNRGFGIGKS